MKVLIANAGRPLKKAMYGVVEVFEILKFLPSLKTNSQRFFLGNWSCRTDFLPHSEALSCEFLLNVLRSIKS